MEDLRQYMFSSLKNNKKCTPTGESIPFGPLMALHIDSFWEITWLQLHLGPGPHGANEVLGF
jgi:hypothetical protein